MFKHSDYLIEPESDIYRQFKAIRTGNEAIAFFARNSKNNPIKFVVCEREYTNKTPISKWRNRPFDLIVPEDGMQDKYNPNDD